MQDIVGVGDSVTAGATMSVGVHDAIAAPVMSFEIVCIGADGREKWRETVRNTVMTPGKTDIIDKYLKGSSYTAAWYVILKGSGSINAADTLASHAGWTEITAYTGNRPAVTWGTTTTGSNTATAVSFAMTGAYTVAGAGCCTVATGTSGVLYNMSDFGAARTGDNGDTLNVTPTISAS